MKKTIQPDEKDLKGIFQSVVDAAHNITALPVSIWAPDKTGKTLRIVSSIGLPTGYRRKAFLSLDEASVTGDAYKNRKPELIPDISKEPRWKYKEDAKKLGWKSVVCVPIITDGIAAGAISAYAYTDRRLLDIRDSLLEYANLVAINIIALRRRRILEKLLQLGSRMQFIAKSPKAVLDLIASDACDVTHADCAVIYPYDVDREEFYNIDNVAHFGLKTRLKLSDRPRSEKGMAAFVKKEREIVIPDIERDDPGMLISPFIKREGIKSFMGIALRVENVDVGILYVDFRTKHVFTEEEKEFIRLFAQQASIVVHSARLYGQISARVGDLEKIQRVGAKMVSIPKTIKSLESILKRIVENTQKVLGADLVDLYQYYGNTGEYELPPVQTGRRNAPGVKKEKIEQDDVIWSVVNGKKPLYIPDSQGNEYLNTPFEEKRTQSGLPTQRFVIREGIKSTAAIPLMVGDEVLGVLFANYRTNQTFPLQHRNLIELYATQAAIAIHNFRIYSESLKRSKRLELVRKVAAKVSSATDIETILQFAVDGLARVFDVKQSAVAIFDEAWEYANVWIEHLEPGCVSAMGHKIPLKNNPQIKKILETKQPLIVHDVQNDPIMASTRKIMAKRKTLSLMVVPIIIEGDVVGTIGIDAVGQKRHFTNEEAELAQAIADQAATALRIARQLEDRFNDFRALQDITEQMHQGDLITVLDLIAKRAVELTDATHGGVWLVNKNRTALEFGGLANKAQYKQTPPNIPLGKNSEKSFSKWVILNGLSYNSGNVHKDKNYKTWYKDTVSELTVPIAYQGKVIGTINVESSRENSFTEGHKRLLEAMARQAAVVVENARLLERLNVLDDIGVELTSGIRLEEEVILEAIYNQVQRLTGAQDMYIALYDENSKVIRFPLATQKGKRVKYPTRKVDMKKRGKTEEIILTRKSIFHKTKKEAEKWYKLPGHEEFVGLINPSWLGVPILVGERVLGVIAVYDLEQEHAYDDQDLQVFSSMASQAAFSLVNRELNRRNAALASLNDIGQELTSGIRLKEENILSLIFTQAQKLTGAKDLYIAIYDEDTGEIRFPLATEKGKWITYPSRKADMEKRGKTEEIIFTRKPILHKTLKEAQEWYVQLGHAEFIRRIQPSWLGVPMMVGERILGVIAAVDLKKEYAFDELDLEALSSMASQAAIAIQNSRLYEEARGEAVAAKQLATLGTATAALQHRINNTFNIIVPNVARLRKRVNTKDKTIAEILDIIERNARYTSDIIGRLQDALRGGDTQYVNINSLLKEVAEEAKDKLETHTKRRKISIQLRLDNSISEMELSSGQIAEVFRNTIENSIRAMKSGGIIKVTSVLDNGKIKVRIIDQGSGIPESMRARLFNQPVPSRDLTGGSGLGLWLCSLTLQSIGGTIKVERTGSKGTIMLIEIPVSAENMEAS